MLVMNPMQEQTTQGTGHTWNREPQSSGRKYAPTQHPSATPTRAQLKAREVKEGEGGGVGVEVAGILPLLLPVATEGIGVGFGWASVSVAPIIRSTHACRLEMPFARRTQKWGATQREDRHVLKIRVPRHSVATAPKRTIMTDITPVPKARPARLSNARGST